MLGCYRVTMRGLSARSPRATGGSRFSGHHQLSAGSGTVFSTPALSFDAKRWMTSPCGKFFTTATKNTTKRRARSYPAKNVALEKLIGEPLQKPAGHLYGSSVIDDENDVEILEGDGTKIKPAKSTFFIPQIALHEEDGRERKRVLV